METIRLAAMTSSSLVTSLATVLDRADAGPDPAWRHPRAGGRTGETLLLLHMGKDLL